MTSKVIRVKRTHLAKCSPIRLRNGKIVADPLESALQFIQKDGSYQKYDEPFVPQDNVLTKKDVLISRKLIARTGDCVIEDVLANVSAINSALSAIPASANLGSDQIPWDALQRLYSTITIIPGIRISRATKILHKKRPALIPILDNEVAKYLRSVEPTISTDRIDEGLALTRSYKKELDVTIEPLTCVRTELKQRGFALTEVRLLDIYIWAYSGIYDAPFMRLRK